MTSLLALLEDLVVAEFTTRDLTAVQKRALPSDVDTPTVDVARRLLDALAAVQNKKPQKVYTWAGARLATHVLNATPGMTRGHTSVRTFLLQLNLLIPKLVAGSLPDAECPEFWGDLMGGDVVRIGFDGDEEVAWLVEGAVGAMAAHFGEQVEITRGSAKATHTERRLIDVLAVSKSRVSSRPISAPRGLSSAGFRG